MMTISLKIRMNLLEEVDLIKMIFLSIRDILVIIVVQFHQDLLMTTVLYIL